MTKFEKEQLYNSKTIAYYSGYSGIEIKRIEHDIDDYVYYVSGTFSGGNRSAHKCKITYDRNGDAYFMYNGNRIKLSECIKNS